MISIHRVITFTTCAAALMASPAFAQRPAPTLISVVATAAAPIFAFADDSKKPMVMAAQGSRLTVIERHPEWYHVKFKNSWRGKSDGYVQIKHVVLVPANESPLKQVDVAASLETLEKRWTYHTLRADIRRRFEQSSRLTPPITDARYVRSTATNDEEPSELKQDLTPDEFELNGGHRFRY
jgi:hypothetical protein